MNNNNSKDRDASSITIRSQKILEEVATKSMSKISKIQGIFNDSQQLRTAWTALGLYISKTLRNGRGISISKFGIFTFSAPDYKLQGVTNPEQRDLRARFPVFIISKEFILGKQIKSGVFYNKAHTLGMRPYKSFATTGQVPIVKMNLSEISGYANMNKQGLQLALHRIIKHLSQTVLKKGESSIQIPHVGFLYLKNNLAAVKFNQTLQKQTKTTFHSQSLSKSNKMSNSTKLTSQNLKKLDIQNTYNQKTINFLKIDQKTKNALKQQYGIVLDKKGKRIPKQVTFGKVQIIPSVEKTIDKKQQIHKKINEQFINHLQIQIYKTGINKQDLEQKLLAHSVNELGFIEQTDFKNILKDIGIHLTLSDLIQSIKLVQLDNKNRIKISDFLNKIFPKETFKGQFRNSAVKKIREWFINEKYNVLDAFRIIDKDNDSYINQKDLSIFLINALKFNSTQLTSVRIQNLINHTDIYKIDKIDLVCFSRLLNKNKEYNKDWIFRAKQQISMQLTRKFQDSKKSFTYISHGSNKLQFVDLKKWLLENKVIDDQALIVEILFDIDDSHKGFFYQHEFKKVFYKDNWRNGLVIQLIQLLQKKYLTSKEAYQSLCDHKKLDYIQFVKIVKTIMQNRYNKQQITEAWYKFAGSDEIITFDRWSKMIGDWSYKPSYNQSSIIDEFTQQNRLIKLISKNRKYLQKKFEQLNQKKFEIEFQIIKRIIKDMVKNEQKTYFEQQIYEKILEGCYEKQKKVNYKKILELMKYKGDKLNEFPKDRLKNI